MKLTALTLNGQPLSDTAFELKDETLTIHSPPREAFEVLHKRAPPLVAHCPHLYHLCVPTDGYPMQIKSCMQLCSTLSCCDRALELDITKSPQVEITTEIQPEKNTLLEGLYMSQGIYCTQCALCCPSHRLWDGMHCMHVLLSIMVSYGSCR